MTPEKAIEKQILHYLWLNNIFSWKNQSTGIYDPKRKIFRTSIHLKGTSDILGVLPDGKILAIEVKSSKGRASPEQLLFLNNVNKNHGMGFIAKSIDDVRDNLVRAGYTLKG